MTAITVTVTVAPVNQPPTTVGIPDVFVAEEAGDTVIDLFAAFDDPEDPDSVLDYTIQSNTNSALFASTPINGALGTLTLDFAPNANGTAEITVRATDCGYPLLSVETTFTVTGTEVNDTPSITAGSINNLHSGICGGDIAGTVINFVPFITVSEDYSFIFNSHHVIVDIKDRLSFLLII